MKNKFCRKAASLALAAVMAVSAIGMIPAGITRADDRFTDDDPGYIKYVESQEEYEANQQKLAEWKTDQEAKAAQAADTLRQTVPDDPEAPDATAGDAELATKGDADLPNIVTVPDENDYQIIGLADYLGNGLTHTNPFYGKSKLHYGIDVSQWNGDINWAAVKAAGIDFAFIRVGFRGYGSSGSIGSDDKAIVNMANARAAGIKIGVYFFSQAITPSEAEVEARFTLNMISGYALDLPVVMDYEYSGNPGRLRGANLTKRQATDCMEAFAKVCEASGYTPMIYASESFLWDQLYDYELSAQYPVWLAHFTTKTDYDGTYNFWQHSDCASVPGIAGATDANVWYDRGESYNKGAYNAYGKTRTVAYQGHLAKTGWETTWKSNRQISGSLGSGRQMESLRIQGVNLPGLNVNYRVFQNGKWTDWVKNGADAGKTGVSKSIQALQVDLSGDFSDKYDVYYCVYLSNQGWLGWAINGETAGSVNYGLPIEALQITIVPKSEVRPATMGAFFGAELRYSIQYVSHVQTYGWETSVRADGAYSGTIDQDKRLEAVMLKTNLPDELGVRYKTHVQTYGWEKTWRQDGEVSGTSGKAKRLEAIMIELTGASANKYDVYYCVYADKFGWLNWAKNGEMAGTAGYAYKMQALRVVLQPKGSAAPAKLGSETVAYKENLLSYTTHVQSYGWQTPVGNGEMAGTEGEYKRLEGIWISLQNQTASGNVEYRTHVQTYGWENGWKKNGQVSGTTGKAKRLEAIQIRLTGEMAEKYDIYYQTHIQTYGWSGWAKNGESCGSEGRAKRLEGIRIMIVPKGGTAPTSDKACFYVKKK